LFLSIVLCVVAQDSSPEAVAFRAANTMFLPQYADNFLNNSGKWYYGSALANIGLFEVLATFEDNTSETQLIQSKINLYLDYFYGNGLEGYNVLNNITMPWDWDIGDHIGLYPVVYLLRYLQFGNPNPNDLIIATRVAEQYVLGWPILLQDGTVSRNTGWGTEPGVNSFLWADDLFMGTTLLNRLSIFLNRSDYIDWVATQKLSHARYYQDPKDGVFFHGYNANDSHISCCKWGRANGWIMMSHVETLTAFEAFPGHVLQPLVLDSFIKHSEGARKLQDKDGRWHQVLDVTDIWLETSVSAMFIYSWSTAILHGWLPAQTYKPVIDLAWKAVATQVLADGTVTNICEGCGIMTDVQGYADKGVAYTTSSPGLGSIFRAAAAYQKLLNLEF